MMRAQMERPSTGTVKPLPEEELVRRGREAVRAEKWPEALENLLEYCERMESQGRPIPPVILANYGLCLGRARRIREGLDTCRYAWNRGNGHPEISLRLAQLYLLADARKLAIEEIERGLSVSPHYRELLKLRDELGRRQRPPIRFLSRGSALNVGLAKLLRKRGTATRT